MKVLVIQGGSSSEREVSLTTGTAVSAALTGSGHEALVFDPAADGPAWITRLIERVERERPDVAFLALHGGDGEDGHIQALLDLIGLPYTGSGMLASALAMDKVVAKELFIHHGVPTPPWRVVATRDREVVLGAADALGAATVVVKPVRGGSTVGTSIVERRELLEDAVGRALEWDDRALLEAYVPGRELTVGVLDGAALPVVEIIPEAGFYDYEHKYTAGRSRYVAPAELPDDLGGELRALGEIAYRVLRCRGGARVDFRLSPGDEIFCLEVNTIPGMTAMSLLPMAAKAAGMSFPELIDRLCRLAASVARPS